MKKTWILLLLFVLLLGTSCKIDFSTPEASYNFCKTTGESVELKYELSGSYTYQWYSCDDVNGSGEKAISGQTGFTFTAEGLNKEGIKYYFCKASTGNETQQSKIFVVFNDKLPSIYITTADGKKVTSRSEYKDAEILVPSFKNEDGDKVKEISTSITIKGRGHKSWESHPKKGYNIKFEEKVKLCDVGEKAKKWGLLSSYSDDTKLANWFASYLGRKVFDHNPWEPKVGYADLYMNGEYLGLYQVSELIQINGKRLDIPNIAELTNSEEGGFIVEFTCVAEYNSFTTLHGASCTMKDPDLDADDEGTMSESEILSYVKKIVNSAESSIFGETKDHYSNYIDVDSFVDWYLVNEFCANSEADFETSVFMYYDPSDKLLHAGPNWDFDKSICNKDGIQVATDRNHWIMQLLKDPAFVEKLQKRWNDQDVQKKLEKAFNKTYDQLKVIKTGLTVDCLRWGVNETTEKTLEDWFNERYVFFDNYINNL